MGHALKAAGSYSMCTCPAAQLQSRICNGVAALQYRCMWVMWHCKMVVKANLVTHRLPAAVADHEAPGTFSKQCQKRVRGLLEGGHT